MSYIRYKRHFSPDTIKIFLTQNNLVQNFPNPQNYWKCFSQSKWKIPFWIFNIYVIEYFSSDVRLEQEIFESYRTGNVGKCLWGSRWSWKHPHLENNFCPPMPASILVFRKTSSWLTICLKWSEPINKHLLEVFPVPNTTLGTEARKTQHYICHSIYLSLIHCEVLLFHFTKE